VCRLFLVRKDVPVFRITAIVLLCLVAASDAFAQVPPAATLTSPTGTITTVTPTYTWQAVSQAASYILWVDDAVQSPKVLVTYTAVQAGCGSGTGTCSVTATTALAPGNAKFWIRTVNASGQGPWGEMSFVVSASGSSQPSTLAKYDPSGTLLSSAVYEVDGTVGIGAPPTETLSVTAMSASLAVKSTTSSDTVLAIDGGTGDRDPYLLFKQNGVSRWSIAADLDANNDLSFYSYSGGPGTRLLIQDDTGNVGIGTTTPTAKLHIVGNVVVDGNIGAKFQDVAEWVEAVEPVAPGTVVIADRASHNKVRASERAYDTAVAGVVSPQPGILLGEYEAGKVAVAQSGRVKVKVDASFGPIAPGDLLVSSPRAGVAMKSTPVRIGDAEVHRPGTIVGKALEPLASGEGEVLTLLTLQ
jgi:hypothetical protein